MDIDSDRRARFAAVLVIGLTLSAPLVAQTEAESIVARDEIWAKEQAIYAGRARGDLSIYLNNTSSHYKGWPPGAKVPQDPAA